jgi:hypothetical protein
LVYHEIRWSVELFESVPGLALLHSLVLALHVVFVEIGVCGILCVCLFLEMTGLKRFVGASFGTQQRINIGVEVEGGKVPTPDWFLNLQILTSGRFR